jgi:hypothetical protein
MLRAKMADRNNPARARWASQMASQMGEEPKERAELIGPKKLKEPKEAPALARSRIPTLKSRPERRA